jgi:hypothetical protein
MHISESVEAELKMKKRPTALNEKSVQETSNCALPKEKAGTKLCVQTL